MWLLYYSPNFFTTYGAFPVVANITTYSVFHIFSIFPQTVCSLYCRCQYSHKRRVPYSSCCTHISVCSLWYSIFPHEVCSLWLPIFSHPVCSFWFPIFPHTEYSLWLSIFPHTVRSLWFPIFSHTVCSLWFPIFPQTVCSLWFPIFPIRDLEPSSELLNGENVKTIANKKEDNLFPILDSSLPDILTMC